MYQLNLTKQETGEYVNRNRLFYCSHQNRKNAFFRKHALNENNISVDDLTEKIFSEQFGFVRIRRSLRESVKKIIHTVIKNQKSFNYSYYLKKNTPLPTNWKVRKLELIAKAADPATRGSVYRELFEESNSSNICVTNFLTEFVYQVFPPNFLEGCNKNKKVFNKRVHQFVNFNRFETFTRISLVEKFKVDEIDWMRYNSNNKNAKYFKRENEFVWWRTMKWVFEELLVSLMRCYFYATEKQKEYSRIFYYRKNVWHLVMKLGTEDLLKQNIMHVEKDEMRR